MNYEYTPINYSFDSERAFSCDKNAQREDAYYQNQRRFSYAGFLSSQSDASLSDFEQQTPSPVNGYVDSMHEFDDTKVNPLLDYTYGSYLATPMTESPFPISTTPNLSDEAMFSKTSAFQTLSSYGYPQALSVPNSIPHFGNTYSLSYPPQPVNYNFSPLFMSANNDMMSSCVPMLTALDVSTMRSAAMYTPPAEDHHDFDLSFGESAASPEMFMSPTVSKTCKPKKIAKEKSKPKTGRVTKSQNRSRGRRSAHDTTTDEDKSFQCKYIGCGKAFKRSEHLKRHDRSIHTLEKPFGCPYAACSKKFSRSDNLNQHIRIHRHTGKDKSNMAAIRRGSSSSESSAGSAHTSYL
ncbi:hypothetical protein BDF14DRAFT_1968018 [Spinellus fusiger]|nr:hypothetical protein BDF14DRAFT_1968018 [Spinellus fusiger]